MHSEIYSSVSIVQYQGLRGLQFAPKRLHPVGKLCYKWEINFHLEFAGMNIWVVLLPSSLCTLKHNLALYTHTLKNSSHESKIKQLCDCLYL